MAAKTLAKRLQELRGIAGNIPASHVDELAGLTRGHTLTIERNPDGSPNSRTALRLCDVFGVSLDWLVDGRGDAPSDDDVRKAVAAAIARAASSTGTDS
jgi:transcriptional regulator with XRE-family HTH domain